MYIVLVEILCGQYEDCVKMEIRRSLTKAQAKRGHVVAEALCLSCDVARPW